MMRKALAVLAILALPLMAFGTTTITKTIKPAGQGGDYTTLFDWEAQNLDLVTLDQIQVAEIDGDWTGVADTSTVIIDGWTTDATHYIRIYTTASARHDGVWDDSKYRLKSPANNTNLTISDPYVRIEGLQIESVSTGYRSAVSIGEANSTIAYNIIRQTSAGTSCDGVSISDADGTGFKIYNNIVYGFTGFGIYINSAAGGTEVYNNTIYGCGTGILASYLKYPIVKDVLAYNNTTDFGANLGPTSDYNFSKDATAPGANSIHGDADGKTPDFVSTTSGSEDFHLQSTSDAIGVGTDDPGSGLYSDDIDGEARTSVWDMGADEYISGAPPPAYIPQVIFF